MYNPIFMLYPTFQLENREAKGSRHSSSAAVCQAPCCVCAFIHLMLFSQQTQSKGWEVLLCLFF